MTNNTNYGWQIQNGSGWNRHRTAEILDQMLADSPDKLPEVPLGYAVLIAPISDKPLGLRCALVRVLPRKIEDGLDDGPDGEPYRWATEHFHIDAEKIWSCVAEQQNDNSAEFFISVMAEQINAIKAKGE